MPLQFDSAHQHCSATVDGQRHSSAIIDITITTNDLTHLSEAQIDGVKVPITEAEADALTVYKARDLRHHTVERDGRDTPSVI